MAIDPKCLDALLGNSPAAPELDVLGLVPESVAARGLSHSIPDHPVEVRLPEALTMFRCGPWSAPRQARPGGILA